MVRLYKAITVIEKNQVFNPTTTPRVFFWMFHGQKQKLPWNVIPVRILGYSYKNRLIFTRAKECQKSVKRNQHLQSQIHDLA